MSRRKRKVTDRQLDQLCTRYVAGESAKALAGEVGVSIRTVRDWFSRRGVNASQRVQTTPEQPETEAMTFEQGATYFEGVDDPPGDPLGNIAWLADVLVVTALQCLADPGLSERERRKELRDIMTSLARGRDTTALYDAKKLLTADAEDLEKTKAGPEQIPRSSLNRW